MSLARTDEDARHFIELRWNPLLQVWTGSVPPEGVGQQTSVGAAGAPGLVRSSEADDVSVALSPEGRVASVWIDQDPSPAGLALLEEFLYEPAVALHSADRAELLPVDAHGHVGVDEQAALYSADRAELLRLAVKPVSERVEPTRRVWLGDNLRWGLPDTPMERFLAHAEYASLIKGSDRGEHQQTADHLASVLASGDLADDLLRHGVDARATSERLERIAENLGTSSGDDPSVADDPSVRLLLNAADLLRGSGILQGSEGDGEYLGGGVQGATALLDSPSPDSLLSELEASWAAESIASENDYPTSFELDADQVNGVLRSKVLARFGLGDEFTMARRGTWWILTGQEDRSRTTPAFRPILWFEARDADGKLVGAGQLGGSSTPGTLRVSIAVPRDAEVVLWKVVVDPLDGVGSRIGLATIEATTRLAHAAWIAQCIAGGGPDSWAERRFAVAAVHLLEAGLFYRAGWAHRFADRELVTGLLGDRNGTEYLAALDAIADSGDVPADASEASKLLPAWVRIANLATMGRDI